MSPLCESYLTADQLNGWSPSTRSTSYVCDQCFLVQLEEYVSAEEIFTEYAYFSSYLRQLAGARAALRRADDRRASA